MIDTSIEGKIDLLGERVLQLNTTSNRIERLVSEIHRSVVEHGQDLAVLKDREKSRRQVFLVALRAFATFVAPLILGAMGAAAAITKIGR